MNIWSCLITLLLLLQNLVSRDYRLILCALEESWFRTYLDGCHVGWKQLMLADVRKLSSFWEILSFFPFFFFLALFDCGCGFKKGLKSHFSFQLAHNPHTNSPATGKLTDCCQHIKSVPSLPSISRAIKAAEQCLFLVRLRNFSSLQLYIDLICIIKFLLSFLADSLFFYYYWKINHERSIKRTNNNWSPFLFAFKLRLQGPWSCDRKTKGMWEERGWGWVRVGLSDLCFHLK